MNLITSCFRSMDRSHQYLQVEKETAVGKLRAFYALQPGTVNAALANSGNERSGYVEKISSAFEGAVLSKERGAVEAASRSYAYAYTNKLAVFIKEFDNSLQLLTDNDYRKSVTNKIFEAYIKHYFNEGDNDCVLAAHFHKFA